MKSDSTHSVSRAVSLFTLAVLIVLAIAVPFSQPSSGIEGIADILDKPIKPIHALIWIVVIAAIVANRRSLGPLRHPAMISLFLFLGAAVISSLFGIDRDESFSRLYKELGFYVAIITAVVLTQRNRRPLRTLMLVIALVGGLEALFCLGTVIAHDASSNLSASMVDLGIIRVGEDGGAIPHGTWENYGPLGRHLVYSLAALILLSPFLLRHRLTVHMAAIGVLLIMAIICSHSRTSWMGLAAGAIALVALGRRRVVVPVLLIAMVLGGLMSQGVISRALTIFTAAEWQGNHSGLNTRLEAQIAAMDMTFEHPFLGIGYSRHLFGRLFEEHCRDLVDYHMGDAHSNPLEIMAEMGLLGLVTFSTWMIALFIAAYRRFRESTTERARHLAASLMAIQIGLHTMGLTQFTWKGDLGALLAIVIGAVTCLSLPEVFHRVTAEESSA